MTLFYHSTTLTTVAKTHTNTVIIIVPPLKLDFGQSIKHTNTGNKRSSLSLLFVGGFSIKKANGAVFMPFAIRFLDVLCTILFIKADNAVLLKIPQIVAMTGFLRDCIKHCINNVPQKKATNADVTVFVAFLDMSKLSFGNVIRFIYVYVINTFSLKYI